MLPKVYSSFLFVVLLMTRITRIHRKLKADNEFAK